MTENELMRRSAEIEQPKNDGSAHALHVEVVTLGNKQNLDPSISYKMQPLSWAADQQDCG